ncbi:MAG: hypothetical protein WKF85_04745 [Chitinophagaceae bacterium]
MSEVSRRFAASPARTPSVTWDAIVGIISAQSETVKKDLNAITGIVSSLIADETPTKDAITIIGYGPRLRIYCLYGDDALADESNEASLSWSPFEKDWEIFFPVEESDLSWVTKALLEKNSRFKTYKLGDKIPDEEKEEAAPSNFNQLSINTDKL